MTFTTSQMLELTKTKTKIPTIEVDTRKTTFYIAQYIFRLLILIPLEFFKYTKGQDIYTGFISTLMFVIVFYSIERLSPVFFFVVLAISITQSISWSTVQTPITYQIMSTFDIILITNDHPEFLVLGIIGVLFGGFISTLKFSKIKIMTSGSRTMFKILSIPLLYLYIQNISNNLTTRVIFRNGKSDLHHMIERIIISNPVVKERSKILKNVIQVQIESFEVTAIDKETTPYLYELTQKYLYMPMNIVPYSSWSASGLLVTQCGIPQIIQDIAMGNRRSDSVGMYGKMNCLPEYFRSAGYNLYYYGMSYNNVQGFRSFRVKKKFSERIVADSDLGLYEYMTNVFIPERLKKPNEHFVALVVNEDTHGPYAPKKYCKPENPKAPSFKQAHNCFDQVIRGFVESFLNSSLKDNTILVLYPDHKLMVTWMPKPRQVFMLLPGTPKREFRENLSYFDFPQTVLDLAGIKSVSPGFLYGNTAFSPEKPRFPGDQELIEMYHSFDQLLNIKRLQYFVCDGVKQSRPCNDLNNSFVFY